MIKATELRVGNWFLNASEEPEQVEEIVTCNSANPINEGYLINGYWEAMCYPIPLKKKVLKAAGLTKEKGQTTFAIGVGPETWGWLCIEEQDFSFYISENRCGVDIPSDSVKTMHELQNLFFALTRRELPFKPEFKKLI